jgi:preprotein translocase subunit SecG
MEYVVLGVHVLAAMGVIGLILIQQGKGAEAGASFGSGASQTFFGSQGSGNFLTRSTAILITLFFVTSLTLGYLASNKSKLTDLDEFIKQAKPGAAQPSSQGISNTESKPEGLENEIPNIPVAPSKSETIEDADKK